MGRDVESIEPSLFEISYLDAFVEGLTKIKKKKVLTFKNRASYI